MNVLQLQALSCRVSVASLVISKIAGFAPSAEEVVSEPSVVSRSRSKRGENENRSRRSGLGRLPLQKPQKRMVPLAPPGLEGWELRVTRTFNG